MTSDALELLEALREEQPTCTKYWLKTEDVGIRLNLNHVETAGFVDGEFKLQMTSGRIHKLTSTKDQIIVLNYLTARTL